MVNLIPCIFSGNFSCIFHQSEEVPCWRGRVSIYRSEVLPMAMASIRLWSYSATAKSTLLPPANVVCEGYVFTGICDSVNRGVCAWFYSGGHAWFYSGGAWFYSGGGYVWFYSGVCMVLFGGACMVLFGGACVVLFGGHAWFYPGGMHGFIWGGMRGFIWGGVRGFIRGGWEYIWNDDSKYWKRTTCREDGEKVGDQLLLEETATGWIFIHISVLYFYNLKWQIHSCVVAILTKVIVSCKASINFWTFSKVG